MERMQKHAERFNTQLIFDHITEATLTERPFILKGDSDTYSCDALIIATGASARYLGLKSESAYMGKGVSACATCDGFFFRNQHVYVVGGGDTAMEEANYLTRFASKVTIIHRREEFRASKIMLERAKKNEKIEFMLNTTIDEYLGETLESGAKKLHSLRILNTVNNETSIVPADGVFVAIGHKPNTDLFKDVLTMDETGYIQTIGKSSYTNIEGVFACGDAQDSVYRQAITAAGSGCMAAIDAERWLELQH
jgi:thioredoxin reductase (NADPH)